KKRDLTMEAAEVEPPKSLPPPSPEELLRALRTVVPIGTADRLFYVADAMRAGISIEELYELTKIDRWFLAQIDRIVKAEERIKKGDLTPAALRAYKRLGFSDAQIGKVTGSCAADVAAMRRREKIAPVYGRVDTCAAEFVAHTPYLYSTYESESESGASAAR